MFPPVVYRLSTEKKKKKSIAYFLPSTIVVEKNDAKIHAYRFSLEIN